MSRALLDSGPALQAHLFEREEKILEQCFTAKKPKNSGKGGGGEKKENGNVNRYEWSDTEPQCDLQRTAKTDMTFDEKNTEGESVLRDRSTLLR